MISPTQLIDKNMRILAYDNYVTNKESSTDVELRYMAQMATGNTIAIVASIISYIESLSVTKVNKNNMITIYKQFSLSKALLYGHAIAFFVSLISHLYNFSTYMSLSWTTISFVITIIGHFYKYPINFIISSIISILTYNVNVIFWCILTYTLIFDTIYIPTNKCLKSIKKNLMRSNNELPTNFLSDGKDATLKFIDKKDYNKLIEAINAIKIAQDMYYENISPFMKAKHIQDLIILEKYLSGDNTVIIQNDDNYQIMKEGNKIQKYWCYNKLVDKSMCVSFEKLNEHINFICELIDRVRRDCLLIMPNFPVDDDNLFCRLGTNIMNHSNLHSRGCILSLLRIIDNGKTNYNFLNLLSTKERVVNKTFEEIKDDYLRLSPLFLSHSERQYFTDIRFYNFSNLNYDTQQHWLSMLKNTHGDIYLVKDLYSCPLEYF